MSRDEGEPSTDASRLAAAIRDAVVEAVRAAYDDAGMRGLCGEGRWEAAIGAARGVDPDLLLRAAGEVDEPAPPRTPAAPRPSLRVRPLEPADRDAWVRMRAALWPDAPAAELAAEGDAYLEGAGIDISAVLVAELAPGRLAGFLELFVRNYAEGCNGAAPHVEAWYVEPESRGRGVGRALMAGAEAWARGQGFRELASDALLDNRASHLAHRAVGFVEVERSVHFRKALP